MRVVYLGTPEFSVPPLKALLECKGVEVVAVVCNRDKPVGRKRVLTAPPVKVFAESAGIPVYQYDKIKNEGAEDMKKLAPDLMVTCAFGQILSKEIIDIPRLGVINVHASLLPKYRGASPINYAILNGEKETGVTIMKTDVGIDTGDVMFCVKTPIEKDKTAGELFNRLSFIGADALKTAIAKILDGTATFTPQDDCVATYTKIIKKEDALIDFNKSAEEIVNLARAFNPAPVAFTYYNGEPFKVFEAEVRPENGEAGKVLFAKDRLVVAAGKGSVELIKVQKAGGKPLSAEEFLRGNKITVGERFGK